MALYNQPNFTDGIDGVIIQVAKEVPSFLNGFLLFIFGVVFFGGSLAQKSKTGYADYPMWSVMASMAIFIITLVLTIKEGMINLETLGIVVSITILSGVWFYLSKGRGEI